GDAEQLVLDPEGHEVLQVLARMRRQTGGVGVAQGAGRIGGLKFCHWMDSPEDPRPGRFFASRARILFTAEDIFNTDESLVQAPSSHAAIRSSWSSAISAGAWPTPGISWTVALGPRLA